MTYNKYKIDQPPIEKGILPVCEALNAIPGVSTIWSCEGHPERPTPPYVCFNADRQVAFKIHEMLGDGDAGKKLKYLWRLTATFDQNGGYEYTICSNDKRILDDSNRLMSFFSGKRWNQSDMEKELLKLSSLLNELA